MNIRKTLMGLALVIAFATPVSAKPTMEECYTTADFLRHIAEQRDEGFPPQGAVQVLLTMGLDSDTTFQMVAFVYLENPEKTPEEIMAKFMNMCLETDA